MPQTLKKSTYNEHTISSLKITQITGQLGHLICVNKSLKGTSYLLLYVTRHRVIFFTNSQFYGVFFRVFRVCFCVRVFWGVGLTLRVFFCGIAATFLHCKITIRPHILTGLGQ